MVTHRSPGVAIRTHQRCALEGMPLPAHYGYWGETIFRIRRNEGVAASRRMLAGSGGLERLPKQTHHQKSMIYQISDVAGTKDDNGQYVFTSSRRITMIKLLRLTGILLIAIAPYSPGVAGDHHHEHRHRHHHGNGHAYGLHRHYHEFPVYHTPQLSVPTIILPTLPTGPGLPRLVAPEPPRLPGLPTLPHP